MADESEELVPDFVAGDLTQLTALVIQQIYLFDPEHVRRLLAFAVIGETGLRGTQAD